MFAQVAHQADDVIGNEQRECCHKALAAGQPLPVAQLGNIVTVSGNGTMPEAAVPASEPDAESARWLRALAEPGAAREAALARLHDLLLPIARREVARRGPRLAITGPELDDLAYQAAADALLAITGKVGQFRGESRFMTWAYKFVVFEVSVKIGRHFWRHPAVPLGAEQWERLPDRFGFDPAREAEWRDLAAAVRQAVDTELTPRQREIFVAIVVNGVPLDALVLSLGSSRNAIYKMMWKSGTQALRPTCTRAGRAGRTSKACWPPSAAKHPDNYPSLRAR